MKFVERSWLVPAALAIAYSAWNLLAWALAQPQEFGDTYRYFGSTLFDIQNPGITTVLLYTSGQDPRLVTFVQVVLSIVVWLALVGAIGVRLRGTWAAWMLPSLVLVLSMTSPIWSWHLLLGSESLAISATVIWLASMLALRQSPSALSLLGNACAAGVLLVTRPQTFPLVLSIELVLLAWRWRKAQAALGSVVAFVGVLASTAWAVTRLELLANSETFRFRYAIDNLVDKRESFGIYVEQHMPPCPPLTQALNGPRPWDDVWQIKEKLIGLCPDSFLWLRSPSTQLTSWLVAGPSAALSNAYGAMLAVTLPIYAPEAIAMPRWLSSVLLPDWKVWSLGLLFVIVGCFVAFTIGVRVRVTWRWVISALLISFGTCAYLIAVWGADGIELNRHLMPVTSLLPIAALLLPSTLCYRGSETATAREKSAQDGIAPAVS